MHKKFFVNMWKFMTMSLQFMFVTNGSMTLLINTMITMFLKGSMSFVGFIKTIKSSNT